MFIIQFVDYENQVIPEDIANDSQFRDNVIKRAKKQLEKLKEIDNVIRELLREEDFDIKKNIGIYAIQFLEKMESFNIEFRGFSFQINKDVIEKVVRDYRILYVIECTIFVPVFSAPKWIKGLVREKDFEMQILAPGFILDDEKFQLEIIEYNSELTEVLRGMANGRLLILYTRASGLNE